MYNTISLKRTIKCHFVTLLLVMIIISGATQHLFSPQAFDQPRITPVNPVLSAITQDTNPLNFQQNLN